MTDRSLEGRAALITGGGRGLGAAIARRFWDAGASVLLVARSADQLCRTAAALPARPSQRAEWIAVDLADPAAPAAIMDRAASLWPALDVLVNNAGIQGPIGPLWTTDPEAWERTIRVNLLAPAALSRLAIPRMPPGGSIVNIAGGGAASPRPWFSAYAAAKAALVRFTETLADETRDRGVRVNAIAPGIMPTDMLQEIRRAGPAAAGARDHAAADAALRAGDAGAFDAPAALCVFLASPAAAGITGRLISAAWDPWRTLADRARELDGTDIYTLRRIVPRDRGLTWD